MTDSAATSTPSRIDLWGRAWNRFWFVPSDPFDLSILRICLGLIAIYSHLSWTNELNMWFGADGILALDTLSQLTGGAAHRWSYLYYCTTPTTLMIAHWLGFAVLVAFTAGLLTRVSCVLSWVVLLSYVHRAPMASTLLAPLLTMGVLYLCLARCGSYLSVDAWWRGRRGQAQVMPNTWTTLSRRLLQVHLSAWYLMLGLEKLAGEPWWSGTAVWWLIARSDRRWIDLTGLYNVPEFFLINFWTHALLAGELVFAVAVWFRWSRPIILIWVSVGWLSLIPITGQAAYCLTMVVLNVVFVDLRRADAGTAETP